MNDNHATPGRRVPLGRPHDRPPQRSHGWEPWRWPIVVVLLAGLLVFAFFRTLDRFLATGERIARAPAEVVDSLGRAVRGFLSGDVTRRFLSSIPTFDELGAGRLEVAVATTTETLARSDEQRAFWDLVSLGTTEVEIRVPVTWRWHVPLDSGWTATVADGVLEVVAPAPRPSLPPAIHTDGIERRVEASWMRFDGAERLAELERELTPLLAARARDRRLTALAREPARGTIARFAELWLARVDPGRREVRSVVVRFADEPARGAPPVVGPANLR